MAEAPGVPLEPRPLAGSCAGQPGDWRADLPLGSSVGERRGYVMRRGIGIPSSAKALRWVGVASVS